jgi:hypothetical protein
MLSSCTATYPHIHIAHKQASAQCCSVWASGVRRLLLLEVAPACAPGVAKGAHDQASQARARGVSVYVCEGGPQLHGPT